MKKLYVLISLCSPAVLLCETNFPCNWNTTASLDSSIKDDETTDEGSLLQIPRLNVTRTSAQLARRNNASGYEEHPQLKLLSSHANVSAPESLNSTSQKFLVSPAECEKAQDPEDFRIEQQFSPLLRCGLLGVLFWFALFEFLLWRMPTWMLDLAPSSKPEENEPAWCARNLFGAIHAVIVSILVVPAMYVLFKSPTYAQFGSTPNLLLCDVDSNDACLFQYDTPFRAVAAACLVFITFTVADLIIISIHGLATLDYLLHHFVFIGAGCITRAHCMMPRAAAILLAMEVSTPFLNYVVFMRNRQAQREWSVMVNGLIFMVLFIIFRILMFTYTVVNLWRHRNIALPAGVEEWEFWFVFCAISVGLLVQFYWLPKILQLFVRKMLL